MTNADAPSLRTWAPLAAIIALALAIDLALLTWLPVQSWHERASSAFGVVGIYTLTFGVLASTTLPGFVGTT